MVDTTYTNTPEQKNQTSSGYTFNGQEYEYQTRYDGNGNPYQVQVLKGTPNPPQSQPKTTPAITVPESSSKITSPFGGSAIPTMQNKLTATNTSAETALNTPPTSTPTQTKTTSKTFDVQTLTPSSVLTREQFDDVMKKTGGDSTNWQQNPDGTWSPASGLDIDTLKSKNIIDNYISPQLGSLSGVKVTPSSTGITIQTSSGAPITLDKSILYSSDGSLNTVYLNENLNAIRTTETNVASSKSVAEARLTQLRADKAVKQAALNKAKENALANAKAAMAAANPYGMPGTAEDQYTQAIEAQFKLQQDALDTAYQSAESQVTSDSEKAVAEAYNTLNSNMTSILDKAQSVSLNEQKFAETQQKNAQTQFVNDAKTFNITKDISSIKPEDFEKLPEVQAAIKDVVANKVYTKDEAIALLKAGVVSQQIASAKAARDTEKQQSLELYRDKMLSLSMARIGAIESRAEERENRQDFATNLKEVRDATLLATKTGEWGQSVNAIIAQLPKAESAKKLGYKGAAALTLIDAMVKIDTDGQAIRQGQVNLLEDSGTYGQSLRRFANKFNLKEDKAGNIVLTKGQGDQIMKLIKETAAEKIATYSPNYDQYKEGVEYALEQHPDRQATILNAAPLYTSFENFKKKYGDMTGGDSGETPTFKEGDTQTKNGWIYKRDANGNWNPIKKA